MGIKELNISYLKFRTPNSDLNENLLIITGVISSNKL